MIFLKKIFKKLFNKAQEVEPYVPPKTISDEYSYINELGLTVFTEKYLLERGYCCENGCKHCPYGFKSFKDRQK